jgi:hypothetical protein
MFAAVAFMAWLMPERSGGSIVLAIYFGASMIADAIKEHKKKQG